MISLATSVLQFQCDPDHALWLIAGDGWRTDPAHMVVQGRSPSGRFEAFRHDWGKGQVSGPQPISSPHGLMKQIQVETGPSPEGLAATHLFALAGDHPFILWKTTLLNQGATPLFIDRIELLAGDPHQKRSPGSKVHIAHRKESLAFYSNGWQSWSYSGTYLNGQRFRRSRLGPLQNPMVVNPGTPVPSRPGHYAADFFGVLGDRTSRKGIITGFLSQRQHFGSVEAWTDGEPSLRIWANGDGARLDPGQEMSTDWAVLWSIDLDAPDPLGPYLDAVARENQVGTMIDVPVGWCSWYHFYQKVSAADIENNLQAMVNLNEELPLDLVQIDDGFEKQAGDWLEFRPTFPDGVAPLAEKIRAAGKGPGLWLAPFIVHPKADLARMHPEWILRGANGRPANAGYVWDTFTEALDLTRPEALDAACEVIHTASHEWGFPYLKLDFLYAGALPGRHHDPTKTRAQILRKGLEAIRQAAGPETRLVGCGVPLGSAVGLFEAMRISCDVSGDWRPTYYHLYLPFTPEPHMPSVRNALQNIIVRAPMHRRWWINDPDCLLARPDTRLTRDEVQNLATAIALTGGSMLISDDMPESFVPWLNIPQVMIPLIGQRARVVDWFDAHTPRRLRLDLDTPAGPYSLIALFNWADVPQSLRLDLKDFGFPAGGAYSARSFWEKKTHWVEWGILDLPDVAPHGVALLALRPVNSGQAMYLGSSLHISQGMELAGWREETNCLTVNLALPRRAKGEVELLLPGVPARAVLDGDSIGWQSTGDGKYAFPVEFDWHAELIVEFDE